ncbi:MAG: hypothetical protein R3Y54_13260, partial [Eubacteriales bacterium]
SFPDTLEYVDAFVDDSGASGCAFRDTRTGEIIVGFAGTNRRGEDETFWKDVITDAKIPDGRLLQGDVPEIESAIDFVESLQQEGKVVQQIVGHSLGGAMAVIVGVATNVPEIVTYNGAPVTIDITWDEYVKANLFNELSPIIRPAKIRNQVLMTTYCVSTMVEKMLRGEGLSKSYKKYEGLIVRFVTDEDFLNKIAKSLNGEYWGEEVLLNNGGEHGIAEFSDPHIQVWIDETLQEKREAYRNALLKKDIQQLLDRRMALPHNLLQKEVGMFFSTGNTKVVNIQPEHLENVATNLHRRVGDTLVWMGSMLDICIQNNQEVQRSKEGRSNRLKEELKEALDSSGFQNMLDGLQVAFEVFEEDAYQSISEIGELSGVGVLSQLEHEYSYSNSEWYVDGYDSLHIGSMVPIFQGLGDAMVQLNILAGTSRLEGVKTGLYQTEVTVGEELVNQANMWLEESEACFLGIGNRINCLDGIPDGMEELLEVQRENIELLEERLEELARGALEIGENFASVDQEIANQLLQNLMKKDTSEVHSIGELNILNSSIFADRKTIQGAYEQQIGENSQVLIDKVLIYWEEMMRTLSIYVRRTFDQVEEVNAWRMKVERERGKELSRTDIERKDFEIVVTRKDMGRVDKYIPKEYGEALSTLGECIEGYLDNLAQAIEKIEQYRANQERIMEQAPPIIERAVYEYERLEVVLQAQQKVGRELEVMEEELELLRKNMEEVLGGAAIESYCSRVEETRRLIEEMRVTIYNCCG